MTDIRLPGLKARMQYLSDQIRLLDMEYDSRRDALRNEFWEHFYEVREIENGEA